LHFVAERFTIVLIPWTRLPLHLANFGLGPEFAGSARNYPSVPFKEVVANKEIERE